MEFPLRGGQIIMSKRIACSIVTVLICLLIYPVLLVTSIELVTYDKSFYIDQYKKLDTATTIGISETDLHRVTWDLLDYIKDKKATLKDIKADINGDMRQVFNDKEIAHMVDVKDLYKFATDVRAYSIIAIVVLLLVILTFYRKMAARKLALSFLWTTGALIVLSAILYLLIQSNFSYYWDLFHHIFFDNDLWLLDPNTDIMIQMVPEAFFYSAVTRVILYFSTASIILALVSIVYTISTRNIRKAT